MPQFTIAIVGLGAMGFGMGQSLLRAGHCVYGFDLDKTAVKRFIAEGGHSGNVNEVADLTDFLVIAVVNAAQVEQVLFEQSGWASRLPTEGTIIACTTVDPEYARSAELRCGDIGLGYLDAPVSGGPINAAKGQLTIMVSGADAALRRAEQVLDAMSQTLFRLGEESGSASAMKAVNQLLAGVHIAAMAEALTFAIAQRIAPDKFLEVIRQCAGTSWMLENRAPHIVEGDYSPRSTVNIWLKDLGIVLDIAKEVQFSAPLAATALQQFVSASASGLGSEDDSAVAKVYAQRAGLTLPGTR